MQDFKRNKMENNPEKSHVLTQRYAEKRAKLVKSKTVTYDLSLRLHPGKEFDGFLRVTFELSHLRSNDLFIDFSGKNIHSLRINFHTIKAIEWNGSFLKLKRNYLIGNGVNTVEIAFDNVYSNDGCGLHSFIDPKDNQQYLYSQCEAYYCNKIFPAFDQPDIKAKLVLTITLPNTWTCIANEAPKSINQSRNEGFQRIQFKPTSYISTYLYAIIAGPYCQITSANTSQQVNIFFFGLFPSVITYCFVQQQEIPMSLYCRASQKESLERQKDFILEVTTQGIQFYETFFQFKFPFSKYDQIFCPEFNAGAMENVGAVTFNDEYLFSEDVDEARVGRFANTILHELAHMWFGNLVTMKWWNDLWLNESFADFISHFCMSKISITGFESLKESAWHQFNMRKSWGYREDQLITTHPIAGNVQNTDVARTVFDGITYAKGAATLKQLLFVVGENLFSESLASYFDNYQFSNATLKDFMATLSATYSRIRKVEYDFKSWQIQWIQKAGLNIIEAYFNPLTQDEMTVVQSSALAAYNSLRRHKIQIAYYDKDANEHVETIYVLPQIDTVIQCKFKFRIEAVMLNIEDHSFVKVVLDKYSLKFFQENFHKMTNTLTRTLIWRSLYEMVRDARLTSQEYFDFFQKAILSEKSEYVIINQFAFLRAAVKAFTPPGFLGNLCEDVRSFVSSFLRDHSTSKNLVVALRPYLVTMTQSEESLKKLFQTLTSPLEDEKEIKPKETQAVLAIHSANSFTREQKRKLYEQYVLSGQLNAALSQRCLVSDFSREESCQLWETFLQKPQVKSLKTQENLMEAFNPHNQYPQFTQAWINSLPEIFKTSSKEYSSLFYDQLFPRTSNVLELSKQLKQLLIKLEREQQCSSSLSDGHSFLLVKKLKQSIDDLSRKERAYSYYIKQHLSKQQIPNL